MNLCSLAHLGRSLRRAVHTVAPSKEKKKNVPPHLQLRNRRCVHHVFRVLTSLGPLPLVHPPGADLTLDLHASAQPWRGRPGL